MIHNQVINKQVSKHFSEYQIVIIAKNLKANKEIGLDGLSDELFKIINVLKVIYQTNQKCMQIIKSNLNDSVLDLFNNVGEKRLREYFINKLYTEFLESSSCANTQIKSSKRWKFQLNVYIKRSIEILSKLTECLFSLIHFGILTVGFRDDEFVTA